MTGVPGAGCVGDDAVPQPWLLAWGYRYVDKSKQVEAECAFIHSWTHCGSCSFFYSCAWLLTWCICVNFAGDTQCVFQPGASLAVPTAEPTGGAR